MTALRTWVQTKLKDHASEHRCTIRGGLTQLNVGRVIEIPLREGGTSDFMAGQIALKVLRFYGRVATAVSEKRIDNERVIDVMADDIIASWNALQLYLRHKTVGDYYRWFRRRYSMASLAHLLINNEAYAARMKAMNEGRRVWPFSRSR